MVRTTAEGRENQVRRHRVLAGLTQAQLAQVAGVSRQTVVAIEAGDYAPSVYLALRIAEQLGATVEALFAGPDPVVPHAKPHASVAVPSAGTALPSQEQS